MWNELDAKLTVAKWNMKERAKDFFSEERGDTNLITIIVVLVIVMALAVVFRQNIASLVNGIWTKIFADGNTATGGNVGSATTFN